MTLTNEPPAITALAAMLALCPSWTTGAAGLWYPTAPANLTALHAVLSETENRRTRYADGALGLPSGIIDIDIFLADTAGNVEKLARSVLSELLAQATGLPIRSGSTGLCGENGPAKEAGGSTMYAAKITIEYGLSI